MLIFAIFKLVSNIENVPAILGNLLNSLIRPLLEIDGILDESGLA